MLLLGRRRPAGTHKTVFIIFIIIIIVTGIVATGYPDMIQLRPP